MRQRSTVTMSMRELDRLKYIQAVIDGALRATAAAERLAICLPVVQISTGVRSGSPFAIAR